MRVPVFLVNFKTLSLFLSLSPPHDFFCCCYFFLSWESLSILSKRNRVRWPDRRRAHGNIHGTACTVEPEVDPGAVSADPEVDGVSQGEGRSGALYSNRWFIMPKKNDTLRFIKDLQSVNKVTNWNAGVGPTID